MIQIAPQLFLLRGAEPEAALAPGLGKLRIKVIEEAEPAPYLVLDTFDGEVRDLDAVLLEAEGALCLIGGDGQVRQQPGRALGAFAPDLAGGAVGAALSGVEPLRSFQVVGQGSQQTRRLALVDKEGKTHLRVQVQVLTPEGGEEGVMLIAVQGLRGYGKAQDRVSAVLAGVAPLGAALNPLLCPEFEPHTAKPLVPLSPTDTALHAACDLVSAHLPVARATEPGIIADYDTEYLHDYRVALRKIRSVMSLFKGVFDEALTADLKARFSDLMAPTGRLRDLDVYLLEKDLYFNLLPDALHPGLEEMFRLFEEERAEALRNLKKQLKSASYSREINRLEAVFEVPDELAPGPLADHAAFDYARGLIWKRYRKVCKIAGGITAQTDDEEVHELRIHCKKLRYLMEFFAPFFPKAQIKGLIKSLKRLQDNLGLFNDYSVQQDSLKAFLDTHQSMPRAQYAAVAQSIGALIAVLHRRQTEERAKVMASFARFDSPEVRAAFRSLFKNGEVT